MQSLFLHLRRLQVIPLLCATILTVTTTPRVYGAVDRTVINTASSGPGSLSQAITDINANGGGNISFNIPGSGVRTITGALPIVTQPVVINGYTQPGTSANTSADERQCRSPDRSRRR